MPPSELHLDEDFEKLQNKEKTAEAFVHLSKSTYLTFVKNMTMMIMRHLTKAMFRMVKTFVVVVADFGQIQTFGQNYLFRTSLFYKIFNKGSPSSADSFDFTNTLV